MEVIARESMAEKVEDADPDYIRYMFDPKTKFACYFTVGDPALGPPEMIGAGINVLAHSKVFRRMFEEGKLAENTPVKLADIQPSTFKYMLKLMYGYNIVPKLTMEEALDLMYVVEKYMVDALKESLATHIASLLTMDNVFIPLKRLGDIQQETLKNAINKKIQFETKALLSHQKFLDLNSFALMHILQQDDLSVLEIELWRAILKWSKHQAQSESRSVLRELLSEHLKYIRFCTLPVEMFVKEVVPTNILTNQEILLITQTFGSQRKQEDLATVCNTIETRNLVCDIKDFSVLRTQWPSETQGFEETKSHIHIITRKRPLLLVAVLCKGTKHFSDLAPAGLKYKCECKVSVSRITDFTKNISTEPPVEFDFSEDIEYGIDFYIPFKTSEGNIKLLANNTYKVVLQFTTTHYWIKEGLNEKLSFSDTYLSVYAGLIRYDKCDKLYGSHIKNIYYKSLTKD